LQSGELILRRSGIWLFLALAVAVGVAAVLVPRADLLGGKDCGAPVLQRPQDRVPAHNFPERRFVCRCPIIISTISAAGLCGLAFLFRDSGREQFIDERER
jgi:hypothetical protein